MHKFLILCFLLISQYISAQNNGVKGYGGISTIYVDAAYSHDNYLCAGGGVIVNDNLIFGAFLNALKIPYRYNFLDDGNKYAENPFSTNPSAISTTINNIEAGFTLGLNIAPEKPFQVTLKQQFGYSFVTFGELSLIDSNDPNGSFIDNVNNIGGINVSLQAEIQLKVGGSFKLGLILGYHGSRINGKKGNDISLLRNQEMFSGFFIGSGLTFGSF